MRELANGSELAVQVASLGTFCRNFWKDAISVVLPNKPKFSQFPWVSYLYHQHKILSQCTLALRMTKTQNPLLIYLNLFDIIFYIILNHGKLVFINFIFTVMWLPWHSSVVLSSVICEYESMSMCCHCRWLDKWEEWSDIFLMWNVYSWYCPSVVVHTSFANG